MSKNESTVLNLLARGGGVAVTFSTKLTDDQYSQLFVLTRVVETKSEMREVLAMVANEWGIEAIVDDA